MEIIRSRTNPLIRRLRLLAENPAERRLAQRCILQGERLIADWIKNGGAIESLIAVEAASQGCNFTSTEPDQNWRVACTRVCSALSPVLDRIGGASGTVAVAVLVEVSAAAEGDGELLFLDGIQDPGNVGSILRTAAAFGVRHCVPGPGCADLWSPKVLRAAMGAHPLMTIHRPTRWSDFTPRHSRILRAADPRGIPAHQLDLRIPGVWIVGAEGRGLSAEVQADPHVGRIAVPMARGLDSLNAAMAQGILLYEQDRQRRSV